MTQEEECKALDAMWAKIQEWLKGRPRFSQTREFRFLSDVHRWAKLEVYPDGSCAILYGFHGDELHPYMIRGLEEFQFGWGGGEMSWDGNLSDLPKARRPGSGVRYRPDYRDVTRSRPGFGYISLRKLFENWTFIKSRIEAEFAADRRLEKFEV